MGTKGLQAGHKKVFSAKKYAIEKGRITVEIETVKGKEDKLMISTCLTFKNLLINEGTKMSDYQYNRFWSKINMMVKAKFRKYFDNELIIWDMDWPQPYKDYTKPKLNTHIQIDLMIKNDKKNWKEDYEVSLKDFLEDAYQEITNYKMYF